MGWIRDAGDEGNADNPRDMTTPIGCEFMAGFFFFFGGPVGGGVVFYFHSEKLENREDDKCQCKKISAEQKLHFHRLWDVPAEKQPGTVEGPWSPVLGRPGVGIPALLKTHYTSLRP